jgi:hypothetical protein
VRLHRHARDDAVVEPERFVEPEVTQAAVADGRLTRLRTASASAGGHARDDAGVPP